MKKIILTVAAVFAFGFANAQDATTETKGFSKGDKWVEGAFSFRSGDVEDSWSFTPKMGYMINDKVGLGGFLAFAGATDNFTEDKSGVFGVGAFVRYYFLSLGSDKAFQAYGEFGLGYSALTNEPNGFDKTTDSAFNANIDLGMNYFFTNHWAATFELANILAYNNANPENGDNSSDLTVNVNLFNNIFAQPQFGLLYKW
ncbi:outer membrane beta-barrel protein [Flavobacterium sp. RSB2_4_14]|uniref:outer membrane beta-barrel protein n=1 Tax=Flavobacterium sp. RSB2_4_14 TaxID=3447665 RepID=UPI003F2E9768